MRAVVQRVTSASLIADGTPHGSIENGLLVLLGIQAADDEKAMRYMIDKIAGLRIFTDANGHMNLSARDLGYALFIVPNFTLYGDCRHGRRPGFTDAAPVEEAEALFDRFIKIARAEAGVPIETGVFQAHMVISPVLDGPVTLLIDSDKTF